MIGKFIQKFFTRNFAISRVENIKTPQAVYNNWTIEKAVKEGYGSNVWVYRSVKMISKSLSGIPWMVKKDSESMPDHHLSKLFSRPNNSISKNDVWELFTSWLQLSGNAYGLKIKVNGRTDELWPISPDRMNPRQGATIDEWIHSYILDKDNKQTRRIYEPDEILHLKHFNPSNPFIGMGPLNVASKVVDTDNDQRDWQKSTMQNRGVIDGVMSFERSFENVDDADLISEKINKKHGGRNARKITVVGGNAKYFTTAMNSIESDFAKSRKDNRDEIFITFGIPPQLGGAQESSTYNNFEISILILWFMTLIPELDDLKDMLNFSFYDELAPGEKICYDLSGVQALRNAVLNKAKTAKTLHEMGVPFEQVNRIFEFGVEEFEGWDKSIVNKDQSITDERSAPVQRPKEIKKFTLSGIEYRGTAEDIEKEVIKNQKVFNKLLAYQQKEVFKAIDNGEGLDAGKIINGTEYKWIEAMNKMFVETAFKFGSSIIAESQRAVKDPLTIAIENHLSEELIILTDISMISEVTAELIIRHVKEGQKEGMTVAQIQQAIVDSGTFSPERALRIARTTTGTAASVGQWTGARLTGAEFKTWETAGTHVRDSHAKMKGVTVGINDFFIVSGHQARFPLDNKLPAGERINCRCSTTYS